MSFANDPLYPTVQVAARATCLELEISPEHPAEDPVVTLGWALGTVVEHEPALLALIKHARSDSGKRAHGAQGAGDTALSPNPKWSGDMADVEDEPSLHFAATLPTEQVREELTGAYLRAKAAAEGDSNDEEIEALQDLVSQLMRYAQISEV